MARKKENNGISLRTIQIWLIIGAVILSVIMFVSTHLLATSYRGLTAADERHIELRKNALKLMDASDYLTEQVQRFTLEGDKRFLDEYFKEAFETRSREVAIAEMTDAAGNTEALEKLKTAMKYSEKLMNREYYAMRLVVEAKGYEIEYEGLRVVTVSAEDMALSPEEKMRRATEMVIDSKYYLQKNQIRDNMNACLDELEKMANANDASALHSLRDEVTIVRIAILLQTAGVIFLVWLTSRLGIRPILNAVSKIKAGKTLAEKGASEFRYLVRAYNKMYLAYKKSIEHLNFKALHDELTGVYNRAGYQSILGSIDLKTTYMILIDVDDFKGINDTYGHEVGDRILVRLVDLLQKNFRSDDFICRIGGDEFVLLMVHSSRKQKDLIRQKLEAVNRELAEGKGGVLPAASISVGATHGSEDDNAESLFEKTDRAMYRSKEKGKRTITFFSDIR